MIAYITGNFALRSVPAWLAILVGTVIFFLLSVSYYVFVWARTRHRAEQPAQNANVLPESADLQRLPSEIGTLKTQISEAQNKAHTLEVDLRGKKQQMKEVQRERDRYKQELDRQISLKEDLDQSFQISRREVAEAGAEVKQLTSDAEEARKEKLLAASNLQGVESDRNNYRAWYNELAWLNPAIEPQKSDISNYVQVIAARPCLLDLKERVAVIDLVIRNDSFFNITIKHDAITGQLSTNKKGLLHDPAEALVDLNHPAVKKLKPTKDARVSIIQRLLRTEAEEIEDALAQASEGYFWLGSLNIPICVEDAGTLEVDSQRLRMNSNVEHVYFREFGKLTFNGEVTTPQELIRDVDALPFPERIRIYQKISDLYGESLWRLLEAKEREDPEGIAGAAIKCNTNNT